MVFWLRRREVIVGKGGEGGGGGDEGFIGFWKGVGVFMWRCRVDLHVVVTAWQVAMHGFDN